MSQFKNGLINIPSEDMKVEIMNLPTVELGCDRFEELVRKETQLEFIKKWVQSKTTYSNNYVDVSDLLVLLDLKKEQEK